MPNEAGEQRYRELMFAQKGDTRGHLVVAEYPGDIPFKIERVFYMFGTQQGVVRGQHANRYSRFLLINVCGSCKVRVDTGDTQSVVALDIPHKGLYLDRLVWKDMYDFSPDSVLLVLSDRAYDAAEYIRDYALFQALALKEGGGPRP